MRRDAALAGTLAFLVAAPGTVAGLVPWLLTGWRLEPALLGVSGFRVAGGIVIAAGLAALLDCFLRFAIQGLGTPAPIAPTERLVATGLYRHVRNPMYLAVLGLILGQSLLFASPALLAYAAGFALVCHLFVVVYEEPKLARAHPAAFAAYRANVPRWLPRPTPWSPSP